MDIPVQFACFALWANKQDTSLRPVHLYRDRSAPIAIKQYLIEQSEMIDWREERRAVTEAKYLAYFLCLRVPGSDSSMLVMMRFDLCSFPSCIVVGIDVGRDGICEEVAKE